MLITGFLFNLAGALFFAGADFLRKLASKHCSPPVLACVVFASIAPLYLALTLLKGDYSFDASGYVVPGLLTVACNLAANLCFIYAVRVSPLSKTIPVLSLSPAITSLSGFFVLGETLSALQWSGIFLILVGVMWIYVPPENPLNFAAVWKGFFAEKGAPLMLITAFCWGVYGAIEKTALQYASPQLHGFIHFACISFFLGLWLAVTGRLRRENLPQGRQWVAIWSLSVVYALAVGFQMLAYKTNFVGHVESLKRVIGQISAVLLGRFVFSEPVTRPKILGILCLTAGVPLVLL